jgi:hypothetical protein
MTRHAKKKIINGLLVAKPSSSDWQTNLNNFAYLDDSRSLVHVLLAVELDDTVKLASPYTIRHLYLFLGWLAVEFV